MDKVWGGNGADTIITGDDADQVWGGKGDDTIDGGFDNDSLYGNFGQDKIIGGEGSDYIDGGSGDDVIYGGQGPEEVQILDIVDVGETPDLAPDNDDDDIYGGGGNDTIYGGDDSDTIHGGVGDDFIQGGIDDDALFGDAGNDIFDFADGDGSDVIGDFTIGEDKVQILGGSFDDLMLSQDESAAIIEYGDLMIRMENMNADDLSASDFLFGDILEPIAVG
jgi:Ca2+-binding RTX toxin-like protein